MEENEKKLLNLIWSSGPIAEAAKVTYRYGKHYRIIIGIGRNNVAEITMTDEALIELCNMNGCDISEYFKW